MGVSISIERFKVGTLLNDIEAYVAQRGGRREGALPVREWFTRVAPHFGTADNGNFDVLCNEYYEDYNAFYEFLSAVTRYYFPELDPNDDTFWSSNYQTLPSGANADEVLDELFPDDEALQVDRDW